MARIRTIKPEFWTDYSLANDLTRDQRLFYIGMWNEADDEGRLQAHPRRLLGAIFPYEEDLGGEFVEKCLAILVKTGRIVVYLVENEPYAELKNFPAHQRINRPSTSRIPSPDSDLAVIHGALTEPSPPEQGTGNREKEQGTDTSKSAICDLWEIWVDELGGKSPHPKLTAKRKRVLEALHREHLRRYDDPLAAFRRVLKAVQRSDHHMSTRSYQMPESLFRNEERRDRWMQETINPSKPKPGTEAAAVAKRPEPGRTYTPGRYVDDGPTEIVKIDARRLLESVGVTPRGAA